jgi:hypothetical protein
MTLDEIAEIYRAEINLSVIRRRWDRSIFKVANGGIDASAELKVCQTAVERMSKVSLVIEKNPLWLRLSFARDGGNYFDAAAAITVWQNELPSDRFGLGCGVRVIS